ncbi:MAG: oxidoreductase [Phycisphaeraceae bacterium]|nr:oxidoreductase [Phycisphaeraceae bacterium]
MSTIRVGIVGLGENTRTRHVPGLLACDDVEIAAVVNRRPESTAAAAKQFDIPRTFERWEDLVADPDLDAIVIGTWPYLHCPITVAALDAGKHVLTEARMAMNADEAYRMLAASRRHPDLVAQIVPSPIAFLVDPTVKRMVAEGYLGDLREVAVIGAFDELADADAPYHWRQSKQFSGLNALFMGIVHEALIRWVPDPVTVMAQTQIFTHERIDPDTGKKEQVGTPDSVQILTQLPGGARGIYHISNAIRFGPPLQIHLYGSEGTIKYLSAPDQHLVAGRKGDGDLQRVDIPEKDQYAWRVEEEFVDAIRGRGTIEFTDFETGVRYMEFTEAVARSAESGHAVAMPLGGSH